MWLLGIFVQELCNCHASGAKSMSTPQEPGKVCLLNWYTELKNLRKISTRFHRLMDLLEKLISHGIVGAHGFSWRLNSFSNSGSLEVSVLSPWDSDRPNGVPTGEGCSTFSHPAIHHEVIFVISLHWILGVEGVLCRVPDDGCHC